MTTKRVTCYELRCDICGDSVQYEDVINHFSTEAELRKVAEECEWTKDHEGRDVCAQCAYTVGHRLARLFFPMCWCDEPHGGHKSWCRHAQAVSA